MIPLFDNIIYPALRSAGINHTPIKRIYTGFLACGLAFIHSRLAKVHLRKLPCHDNHPSGTFIVSFERPSYLVPTLSCAHVACLDAAGYPNPTPISVWVISGPYILLGVTRIFASITSLEFAFTKVSTGLIHPKIHSILCNQRTPFADLVFSLSKSLPYRHQNKRTVSSPPSFNSKTLLRPRWDSPLRR